MILFICTNILNLFICWQENAKLKWSDFQGEPNNKFKTTLNTNAGAVTATRLTRTPISDEKGFLNYDITVCFIKDLSFTTDTTSSELLQHEQLHFDIMELYARKIRKSLSLLVAKKSRDRKEFDLIIDEILLEEEELSKQYDIRTGNGGVDFVQEEWNLRIQKELDAMKAYAAHPNLCSCETINKNN
ncbi:DUF922 domain-containing protein [Rufibacter roseus]|uniref:DUF922 domain-containing protein n=1 Tax=Rufibacter roseus TaxID=1567108 RepID=A0ABW2DLT8_9BACT|nr:DUF922 domain-containing protein [Rufibacter roseus]